MFLRGTRKHLYRIRVVYLGREGPAPTLRDAKIESERNTEKKCRKAEEEKENFSSKFACPIQASSMIDEYCSASP